MRTLFANGKIYLERNHFAEAILIEVNTIKKVGSNLELIPYIIDSNVIDLQGYSLLPVSTNPIFISMVHLNEVHHASSSFGMK